MDALLEKLVEENRPFTREGRVAGYIPELAKADRDELGICVVSSDGRISSAGEYRRTFTIQSIIKPILLLLALMDNGEDTVRARVGVEATGKPFDAINYTDQALLSEHLNPMVNMGAILLCTLIHGTSYSQRLERLLELTRRLAGDPSLSVDEAVYRSEKQTGSRNRAMAFLLESCGLLHDDPEEVLDCYFRACSIRVDCRDLAHIACTFAGRGRRSPSGERLFPARYAHYVNAVLMTCGMYNGSGDFAVKVGLPAKSGVGGGIMAVSPARMGIGIYSPGLDEKGNSLAGIRLLEQLGRRLSRQHRFVLEGELYTRTKGDPGHLLFPSYNRKNIALTWDRNCEGSLFTPELAGEAEESFRFLKPYYDYFLSLRGDPAPDASR